jgi:hypothetical protein
VLCRTGLVWDSTIGDRALTFELIGLNNQNFIMKDRETGSWWQQVTGRAIRGPLAGQQLSLIPSEISTFALWSREHPDALVLAPQEEHESSYFDGMPQTRGGDDIMMPFPTPRADDDPLEPGELVIGLEVDSKSKAYPMRTLLDQRTVIDHLGGRELLLVVGDDDETVRCFDRNVDGRLLELFRKADATELTLVDKETGTEWSFAGDALSGQLAGSQLSRVPLITEYWFDWRQHHPETQVFAPGR